MARYSDASFAGDASTNRFYVWDDPANDTFDAAQLAKNWDRVDAIIGRPTDNTTWPLEGGVGGGIWKQIELLRRERPGIGDLKPWWFPFGTTNPSTSAPWTAAEIDAVVAAANPGWVVADGRKLLSSEHEFPNISTSIYVPDMRNAFPLGASIRTVDRSGTNTVVPPGTAGGVFTGTSQTIANIESPQGAPGITQMVINSTDVADADGVIRGIPTGITGGNAAANASLTIPDHYHDFIHTHPVVPQVTTAAMSGTVSANTGVPAGYGSAPSGTTLVAAATNGHVHTNTVSVAQTTTGTPVGAASSYTVGARSGDSLSSKNVTSLQRLSATDGSGNPIPGRTGSSASDWPSPKAGTSPGNAGGSSLSTSIALDKRPRSIGLLWLIKVKNISTVS